MQSIYWRRLTPETLEPEPNQWDDVMQEVPMSENRHPGINMHKLPVGGGFIGLLFAVGCATIFILGFPTLWYFVALSAGLGVIIALMIKFIHERTSSRNQPLSILSAEKLDAQPRRRRQRWHREFRVLTEPAHP